MNHAADLTKDNFKSKIKDFGFLGPLNIYFVIRKKK